MDPETQRKRAKRAARFKAGRCVTCARKRDVLHLKQCSACRVAHRAHNARNYRRRKGCPSTLADFAPTGRPLVGPWVDAPWIRL